MRFVSPAVVAPTLIADRGGRRLTIDPVTLAAALRILRPQPAAAEDGAVQAAGDARLRSAGLLTGGVLTAWAARLLGPLAAAESTLDLEVFECGHATSFHVGLGASRATLIEHGSHGLLTLSAVPAHLGATLAELVGLEEVALSCPGEAVRVDRHLFERFLARLASGDTPRAGALLAGRPVPVQALRVLLALADGRARWWCLERMKGTDRGQTSVDHELHVVDAGTGGLWCSHLRPGFSSSELVLAPTSCGDLVDRLNSLCEPSPGITIPGIISAA